MKKNFQEGEIKDALINQLIREQAELLVNF